MVVVGEEPQPPPPAGVNVYVLVVFTSTAGDHVPEIPFVDVTGSVKFSPAQNGPIWLKVGVAPPAACTLIVKLYSEELGQSEVPPLEVIL